MVGSIDPRCETVRGIHWPATGRGIVWNSRRGNHLGQRPKATASTGRTYGCKRSDQTIKNSCSTGAVHIWSPLAGNRSRDCLELASRKPSWPAAKSDRINRPDIWMQAIRSDHQELLQHGGRPHMDSGLARFTRAPE